MKACLARVKRAAYALWYRGSGEKSNSDNVADNPVQSDRSVIGVGSGAAAKMGGLSSKEAKEVEHIIREFIVDELKYVQALDLIEELFVEPLRTAAVQAKLGIPNGNDFAYQVFANWSSIRSLHRDVATRLLETCTTARPSAKTASAAASAVADQAKMGGAPADSEAGNSNFSLDPAQAIKLRASAHRILPQIFVEFVPFFKIYSEFLNVQGGHLSISADTDDANKKKKKKKKPKAGSSSSTADESRLPVHVLENQARKSRPFKLWLAARCANPRMKNLGIEAFLAKPFQRLCRYPLYLGRLLELHGAQESEGDVERVRSAMFKLRKVIDSVDLHLHNVQAAVELAAVEKALRISRSISRAKSSDSSAAPPLHHSHRNERTGVGLGDAAVASTADDHTNSHEGNLVAPNKRCLAFGQLSYEIVTAGYHKSWHSAQGRRIQALLMPQSLILYRNSSSLSSRRSASERHNGVPPGPRRRSSSAFASLLGKGKEKVLATAEGTDILDEIEVTPECRVRRVKVVSSSVGASESSSATTSSADSSTIVVPRALAMGRFCLHLLAHTPSSDCPIQSFLLSFDTATEQDAWYNQLERLINPRPKVPPKSYPKGLNSSSSEKSAGNRNCVIS